MKTQHKLYKFVLTQENLKTIRRCCFPQGSGPLAIMRLLVGLIDAVAAEKGWDVGQHEKPLYEL